MTGGFMANGKRNIIRTRDYAMVRIIQGVTKSGPHRSSREYSRKIAKSVDSYEDCATVTEQEARHEHPSASLEWWPQD